MRPVSTVFRYASAAGASSSAQGPLTLGAAGCALESQEAFYAHAVRPFVDKCLLGSASSIVACGGWGCGKSFTIGVLEPQQLTSSNDTGGIVSRCLQQIYEQTGPSTAVEIVCVELQHDEVLDLIPDISSNGRGITPLGIASRRRPLSVAVARSLDDALEILRHAVSSRQAFVTDTRHSSSRTHAVFQFRWRNPSAGASAAPTLLGAPRPRAAGSDGGAALRQGAQTATTARTGYAAAAAAPKRPISAPPSAPQTAAKRPVVTGRPVCTLTLVDSCSFSPLLPPKEAAAVRRSQLALNRALAGLQRREPLVLRESKLTRLLEGALDQVLVVACMGDTVDETTTQLIKSLQAGPQSCSASRTRRASVPDSTRLPVWEATNKRTGISPDAMRSYARVGAGTMASPGALAVIAEARRRTPTGPHGHVQAHPQPKTPASSPPWGSSGVRKDLTRGISASSSKSPVGYAAIHAKGVASARATPTSSARAVAKASPFGISERRISGNGSSTKRPAARTSISTLQPTTTNLSTSFSAVDSYGSIQRTAPAAASSRSSSQEAQTGTKRLRIRPAPIVVHSELSPGADGAGNRVSSQLTSPSAMAGFGIAAPGCCRRRAWSMPGGPTGKSTGGLVSPAGATVSNLSTSCLIGARGSQDGFGHSATLRSSAAARQRPATVTARAAPGGVRLSQGFSVSAGKWPAPPPSPPTSSYGKQRSSFPCLPVLLEGATSPVSSVASARTRLPGPSRTRCASASAAVQPPVAPPERSPAWASGACPDNPAVSTSPVICPSSPQDSPRSASLAGNEVLPMPLNVAKLLDGPATVTKTPSLKAHGAFASEGGAKPGVTGTKRRSGIPSGPGIVARHATSSAPNTPPSGVFATTQKATPPAPLSAQPSPAPVLVPASTTSPRRTTGTPLRRRPAPLTATPSVVSLASLPSTPSASRASMRYSSIKRCSGDREASGLEAAAASKEAAADISGAARRSGGSEARTSGDPAQPREPSRLAATTSVLPEPPRPEAQANDMGRTNRLPAGLAQALPYTLPEDTRVRSPSPMLRARRDAWLAMQLGDGRPRRTRSVLGRRMPGDLPTPGGLVMTGRNRPHSSASGAADPGSAALSTHYHDLLRDFESFRRTERTPRQLRRANTGQRLPRTQHTAAGGLRQEASQLQHAHSEGGLRGLRLGWEGKEAHRAAEDVPLTAAASAKAPARSGALSRQGSLGNRSRVPPAPGLAAAVPLPKSALGRPPVPAGASNLAGHAAVSALRNLGGPASARALSITASPSAQPNPKPSQQGTRTRRGSSIGSGPAGPGQGGPAVLPPCPAQGEACRIRAGPSGFLRLPYISVVPSPTAGVSATKPPLPVRRSPVEDAALGISHTAAAAVANGSGSVIPAAGASAIRRRSVRLLDAMIPNLAVLDITRLGSSSGAGSSPAVDSPGCASLPSAGATSRPGSTRAEPGCAGASASEANSSRPTDESAAARTNGCPISPFMRAAAAAEVSVEAAGESGQPATTTCDSDEVLGLYSSLDYGLPNMLGPADLGDLRHMLNAEKGSAGVRKPRTSSAGGAQAQVAGTHDQAVVNSAPSSVPAALRPGVAGTAPASPKARAVNGGKGPGLATGSGLSGASPTSGASTLEEELPADTFFIVAPAADSSGRSATDGAALASRAGAGAMLVHGAVIPGPKGAPRAGQVPAAPEDRRHEPSRMAPKKPGLADGQVLSVGAMVSQLAAATRHETMHRKEFVSSNCNETPLFLSSSIALTHRALVPADPTDLDEESTVQIAWSDVDTQEQNASQRSILSAIGATPAAMAVGSPASDELLMASPRHSMPCSPLSSIHSAAASTDAVSGHGTAAPAARMGPSPLRPLSPMTAAVLPLLPTHAVGGPVPTPATQAPGAVSEPAGSEYDGAPAPESQAVQARGQLRAMSSVRQRIAALEAANATAAAVSGPPRPQRSGSTGGMKHSTVSLLPPRQASPSDGTLLLTTQLGKCSRSDGGTDAIATATVTRVGGPPKLPVPASIPKSHLRDAAQPVAEAVGAGLDGGQSAGLQGPSAAHPAGLRSWAVKVFGGGRAE